MHMWIHKRRYKVMVTEKRAREAEARRLAEEQRRKEEEAARRAEEERKRAEEAENRRKEEEVAKRAAERAEAEKVASRTKSCCPLHQRVLAKLAPLASFLALCSYRWRSRRRPSISRRRR